MRRTAQPEGRWDGSGRYPRRCHSCGLARQPLQDRADERRPSVDQTGVDLNQRRAGVESPPGIVGVEDAPTATTGSRPRVRPTIIRTHSSALAREGRPLRPPASACRAECSAARACVVLVASKPSTPAPTMAPTVSSSSASATSGACFIRSGTGRLPPPCDDPDTSPCGPSHTRSTSPQDGVGLAPQARMSLSSEDPTHAPDPVRPAHDQPAPVPYPRAHGSARSRVTP